MAKKYKLNTAKDIDMHEGGYMLYLQYGWRFNSEIVHCRNFDTMAELRAAVRDDVIPCDCAECLENLTGKGV
jgi:hypothetical protein